MLEINLLKKIEKRYVQGTVYIKVVLSFGKIELITPHRILSSVSLFIIY